MIGDPYQDRHFRKSFQQYLNNLWEKKDKILQDMIEHGMI